jgi:tetratricopeptide (TPR) repeat protein
MPELLSPIGVVVAASCVVAVFAIVYAPSLDFQFILDDHRFTNDPRIQFSGHIWDYFTSFVWAQFTGGPPSFYRPIFLLWMRINYILCDLSTWGWHLLSVMKHAAVAVLLAWLVWKLLRDRGAALLAAALFALHPAHTESVAWVTVPDPLMALGVFGSLLLYLKYLDSIGRDDGRDVRRSKARKKAVHPPSCGTLFGASFICLLALGAKETGIVIPAVVFALAFFSRQKAEDDRGRQSSIHDRSVRARLARAALDTAPFAAATLLYLLLRFVALGNHLSSRTQHLTLTTVIFSWPATLWFYVKVLFWPVRSRAFADPTVVHRFSLQAVLLPLLGILCTTAALAVLISQCWRTARRNLTTEQRADVIRALLIGAILLVLPLLAALDLNALNPGDFLHGRYTYLPLAGLMILLSTAWHLAGRAQLGLLIFASALTITFAALTFSQEKQWQDDLTVFTTAHALAPNNRPVAQNLANAHIQQALQLGEQGRCNEAVPVFEQVTSEFPNDWYAWAALGDCLVELNDLPRAEESLHKAADLSHDQRTIERWQEVRTQMKLPPAAPK